jgi:DNA polymerase III alpha subunit
MFLCAQGNDAGDSYCCLRTDRGYVHEVYQYKHKKVVVDQESYQTEFEKAASKEDFFIFFTTSHASVHSLPPRCAIVDASCWQRYYGPYWARAFYIKDVNFDFPCINTSKAFRLESVFGIGKKRRLKIVDERQTNGKFKNLEDAVERLWNGNKVVPPSVLKRFRYE